MVLGPRQHRIAQLAAQGVPRQVIADRLGLSRNTVRASLRIVYRRLNVRSRVELVAVLPQVCVRPGGLRSKR